MCCSDTIKEIRITLNMSQEELARELGVSFATINRWENNKSQPSKLAKQAIKELCIKKNINYGELSI